MTDVVQIVNKIQTLVPAGSVKVLLPQGESRIVSTPEALQEAVLPSPAK